jgi:cyclophilin family peptidyl-prolyl cis-trans isomerase/HEAT repeat protein
LQRLGLVLRSAALIALAGTLGTVPGPSPYKQILILERQRSLGNGQLGRLLDSTDERVAVRAALAIGRTKLPAGEPLLAAHAGDARDAVRAMSVYGLGLLATGGDAAKLVAAIGDRSGAVRVAALDAVARYEAAHRFGDAGEDAAQNEIEHALANDSDPIVRGRAAVALVEFRSSNDAAEASDALSVAFLNDTDVNVRRHAMWTIYRGFATKVNRRLVEAALHDGDEIVRIEAVRAMGRYADRALIAYVKPLLADPSWRVQEQAGETILALDGKPLTQHWTHIPAYVHVVPPRPDPLAALKPLPRTAHSGRPAAPDADAATFEPLLDPKTSQEMTEPAAGSHPRVRIVTTKGNVYVVLYPEWAPLTVANFLALANRGYYDGNRWFRIVPDFVVQTGDPNDNGDGDAGYSIGAEENPLEQRSGIISMGMNYDDKTNMPIRDSAGTQYYITLSPQYHLDRDFTVYGEVTSGFDVLSRLIEADRVVRIERIADEVLP